MVPPEPPHDVDDPEDIQQVVASMHEALRANVPEEYSEPRMALWTRNQERLAIPEPWHTLEPTENLEEWMGTLQRDLGIDAWVIQDFAELLQHGGGPQTHWGFQEACRNLAHLMKDSASERPRNINAYFKANIRESIEAINSWRLWDCAIRASIEQQAARASSSSSSGDWGWDGFFQDFNQDNPGGPPATGYGARSATGFQGHRPSTGP